MKPQAIGLLYVLIPELDTGGRFDCLTSPLWMLLRNSGNKNCLPSLPGAKDSGIMTKTTIIIKIMPEEKNVTTFLTSQFLKL